MAKYEKTELYIDGELKSVENFDSSGIIIK